MYYWRSAGNKQARVYMSFGPSWFSLQNSNTIPVFDATSEDYSAQIRRGQAA